MKQGLIMQFDIRMVDSKKLSAKCFSCNWLSDYGNEKEYLFIQMGWKYGLNISNIVDKSTGFQYKLIFQALQNIQYLIQWNKQSVKEISLDPYIQKIMEKILCTPFKSLSKYAKLICNNFFSKINFVMFDHYTCKKNTPRLFKLLSDENECVDIRLLESICPNAKSIEIRVEYPENMSIILSYCDYVLDYFKDKHVAKVEWKFESPQYKNSLQMYDEVIDKYGSIFESVNVLIYRWSTRSSIKFDKQDHLVIASATKHSISDHIYILNSYGGRTDAYIGKNNILAKHLEFLINEELSNKSETWYHHQFAVETIKCTDGYHYGEHLLFNALFNLRSGFVYTKPTFLTTLFPNLQHLEISQSNINSMKELCTYIQLILDYFKTNRKSLIYIEIDVRGQSFTDIDCLIQRYASLLEQNNVLMYLRDDLNWGDLNFLATQSLQKWFKEHIINTVSDYIFGDNTTIAKWVNNLLVNEISNIKNCSHNNGNNEIQKKFHKKCIQTTKFNWNWPKSNSKIFHILCNAKSNMIKLEVITDLYPNLKNIYIENINVSSGMLDDILRYAKNKYSPFPEIRIGSTYTNEATALLKQAVYTHASHFSDVDILMYYESHVYFQKENRIVIIKYLLNNLGVMFHNKECQTIIRLQKLIKYELSQFVSEEKNSDQYLFHQYCLEKKQIEINLTEVANIHPCILEILFDTKRKWIKVDVLMILFPNLRV
eukprot:305490_1